MGPQLICSCIGFMIIQIIPFPIVYNIGVDMSMILASLVATLLLFMVNCMFGMLVTYVVQLKGKMSQLMIENLKLLDKMHEGLIVISEKDRRLQFASKPAISIIKQMPRTDSGLNNDSATDKNDQQTIEIDEKDLDKPLFNLTTVSVKTGGKIP